MNDLLYQREHAAKATGRRALELNYDPAGEIEAREVAARQRMTPEQRKNSPPRLGDENTVFAESNSYAEEYIPGDVSAAELESGINYVAEMSSVSAISGTEFTTEGRTLLDDVDRFFKSVGGQVYNARLGDINLTRRGVKDSLAHGMTPQKAAAFFAIPDVLRNGKVVGFEKNWKGRGYDSATVAAPVTIGGEEYIMAVVVHRSNSANRFYVHDVIAVKKEATPFMTGAQNLGKPGGATSTISIIKRILDVKGQASLSLADDLAPVARAGEVYGEDIGIEAPVREDLDVPGLDTENVSYLDTSQIQAQIDELTAQRDTLGDRLNEMADRGEFGAEYDRLGNEWGELNRQVQELESQLPAATIPESPEIKLTKKATADIVREVRSALGLTNQQIADCREVIEAYRIGEIQSKEALVEALQTQFGLYTETHRDQQLEEVKRATRTRGIKVPEAVKRAIPDYADIRRKNFGKVRLTESGLGIDEVYHELESLYPGYFNENRVSNPEDQLLQMIELANTDHIAQDQRVKDAADVEMAADAIVKAVNIAKWDL